MARGEDHDGTKSRASRDMHQPSLSTLPIELSPLDEFSALIIVNYAPWLDFPSVFSDWTPHSFPICASWIGQLPIILGSGGRKSILSSAIGALGLLIMDKINPALANYTAATRAYCSALTLLRDGLQNISNDHWVELVVAGMCLSLAEVRGRPTYMLLSDLT